MLKYLCEKRETEDVRAVFQNQRIEEAENDPGRYKKRCDKRASHIEWHFGRMKLTKLLDDHSGRGGWKPPGPPPSYLL